MATEDILINDGDGFVSLSALAAEQVEPELPISSADGSVVLKEAGNQFVVEVNTIDQLVVSSSDISASSTYSPATENSLTTKRYVDQITGSNVEEIPFGGRNTDWKEKSVTVDEYIDGNELAYYSRFRPLVAARGIFSDGLHWTGDGITWYSSGRDKTSGDLHVLPDEYRVVDASHVAGLGIYVCGKQYSADMKTWFPILGQQATHPFVAGTTVYANQGNVTLQAGGATGFMWVDVPWQETPVLGAQPKSVASDDFGFCVAVSASGEAWWGLDSDGIIWQKIDGLSGLQSCIYNPRNERFIFISRDTWWCSKTGIPDQGFETGPLPVSDNWTRMCDDGQTITAMVPAAGKDVLLMCETYNSSNLIWRKTGDYNYTGTQINNRAYQSIAGTNGRTIASMASVAEGSQSDDYSTTYYYSVAGENRDLGVFTDDVKLINAVGTRAVIDTSNLKTQEDANQYFDGRLDNAGNLLLGTEDSGGVWAAGTIGKALEDISKAEGPAGADGKGWTGGSYSSSTGIVTFTSNDGLGFATGDLRGGDGKGWTGGSYSSATGIVTFTSDDGLGFSTGDLRGTNGTNGTNGTDGTSVDLTTVGVSMTDCDLAPADANGAFTADGTEADGTQKYKLDLNLPRGTVVTTSASEPPSAGRCVGDLWLDTST